MELARWEKHTIIPQLVYWKPRRLVIQKPYKKITVTCAFPQLNLVHRILAAYDARILDTYYGDEVKFISTAEANKTESLKFDLIEASQNQIMISLAKP